MHWLILENEGLVFAHFVLLEFRPLRALILVARFARNDLVVFARWGQKHICYIRRNGLNQLPLLQLDKWGGVQEFFGAGNNFIT